MTRAIGAGLIAVGVILLIFGFQETESFASDVSEFFSGSPTDRAIWMLVGGVFALVVGVIMTLLKPKA